MPAPIKTKNVVPAIVPGLLHAYKVDPMTTTQLSFGLRALPEAKRRCAHTTHRTTIPSRPRACE